MNIENLPFVLFLSGIRLFFFFFLDWEIAMSYLFSFKDLFIKQGSSSDGGLSENVLFCLGEKPWSKNHGEVLC